MIKIKHFIILALFLFSILVTMNVQAEASVKTWMTPEEIVAAIEGALASTSEEDVDALRGKIDHHEPLTAEEIDLVIKAKELRVQLVNNESDYTELHLLDQLEEHPALNILMSLSTLDSEEVRYALHERFYSEHIRNRTAKGHKVVIQGAGPLGLFAAMKLFLAGSNITIIDKRSEVYELKQIVRFDAKWVAELHLYAGMEFNELLEKGQALMRPSGYVEIPLLHLSTLMKLSIARMVSYVQDVHGARTFDFFYEFELKKITGPVVEGASFVAQGMQKKAENTITQLEFDMLVFAGGANDKLRDYYLSHAVERTESRMYMVGVWDKAKTLEFDKDTPENFRGGIQENISHWLKDYSKLKIQVSGKKVGAPKIAIEQFDYRFFHNADVLYIGIQYPESMQKLIEDLESTQSTMASKPIVKGKFADLQKHVEDGITELVLSGVGVNLAQMTIDEATGKPVLAYMADKKNTARFMVSQRAVDTPARTLSKNGGKAQLTVIGDALVSPHFFSGSGMSSGREGINNLAAAVQAINSGADEENTIALLNEKQQEVIEYTLEKGKNFCPPLSSEAVETKRLESNKKEADAWVNTKSQPLSHPGHFLVQKNGNDYDLQYLDLATEEERQIVFGVDAGGLYIISHDAEVPVASDRYPLMYDLLRDLGLDY